MAEKILMGRMTQEEVDGITEGLRKLLEKYGRPFDSVNFNRWGMEIHALMDFKGELINISITRKELEMKKYEIEKHEHSIRKGEKDNGKTNN